MHYVLLDESYQMSKVLKKELDEDANLRRKTKHDDCYAFAKSVAESDACDRSAFAGQENSIYLQWFSVKRWFLGGFFPIRGDF